MRIPFLDWLRIFAFTSVLIGHKYLDVIDSAIADPHVHSTAKLILGLSQPLLFEGGAGAVVFLMISGYIITHVLMRESSIEFLIKRIFRIYPLYLTAVILHNLFLMQDPGYSIIWGNLIPQLMLIGDFVGVPYALSGVEWTLRIEIVFYLFMAVVKMDNSAIPFAGKRYVSLLFVSVACIPLFPPFPSQITALFTDYFFLYAPFLFVGSAFYLLEINKMSRTCFSIFVALVFSVHFHEVMVYQPKWGSAHFAILAFMIFGISWYFRAHFESGKIVMLISNLTYSIYLFHNWFFDFILRSDGLRPYVLIILFGFCFLCHILIEKPGISLGKRVLKLLEPKYKKHTLKEVQLTI
jgi:peptidoglycan/LPS O-acetylase OafA/YrhL